MEELEVSPDLVLRDAQVPIDKSWNMNRLVGFVKRVLHLPRVTKMEITPESIYISRVVAPGEPGVPDEVDTVSVPFEALISKPIELLPDISDVRFTTRIQKACSMLNENGYVPSLLVAPEDPNILNDVLPFEQEGVLTHLFGIPVQYDLGTEFHNQAVLFGGATPLYDDIQTGIAIEMETV